jgi:hypothetical protein
MLPRRRRLENARVIEPDLAYGSGMKTVALLVVLGVFLAGAIAIAVRFGPWDNLAQTSVHMWIALGLGVTISLALGVGLMALSFHSSKHGYDDAATRDD